MRSRNTPPRLLPHITHAPALVGLEVGADHPVEIGLLERVDLSGIYDLRLLNEVLSAAGKTEVNGL